MSVTRQQLFRPESLDARQSAWLGRHTLALGAPATLLSFASILITLGALAILVYGTYARRVELHGAVLPTTGPIQASAPVSGRIETVAVQDNAHVDPGTLLYVYLGSVATTAADLASGGHQAGTWRTVLLVVGLVATVVLVVVTTRLARRELARSEGLAPR